MNVTGAALKGGPSAGRSRPAVYGGGTTYETLRN